ncbi:hypothetical protein MRX96_004441 [Rhipicephalus microplus]
MILSQPALQNLVLAGSLRNEERKKKSEGTRLKLSKGEASPLASTSGGRFPRFRRSRCEDARRPRSPLGISLDQFLLGGRGERPRFAPSPRKGPYLPRLVTGSERLPFQTNISRIGSREG